MIRPHVTITRASRDAFAARIYRDAAREARILAEADGRAMVAIANDIIANELPRRDGRRHKANTTHLEVALTYRIHQPRSDAFPITVTLLPKPGVSAKKIAALEFGVDHEYEITAVNATYLRWGQAPGDLRKPFTKSVTWSPYGPNGKGQIAIGYHFMERARDQVAARHRG